MRTERHQMIKALWDEIDGIDPQGRQSGSLVLAAMVMQLDESIKDLTETLRRIFEGTSNG